MPSRCFRPTPLKDTLSTILGWGIYTVAFVIILLLLGTRSRTFKRVYAAWPEPWYSVPSILGGLVVALIEKLRRH